MTDSYREWDAGYVLGVLSADDRLEFERHLEKCDRCRASVAELAGIPGILAKLPVVEAIAVASVTGQQRESAFPELGMVQRLAGLEVRRSRMRTMTAAIAAAALVVVLLGGLWASNVFAPGAQSREMLALGQNVVTAQLSVMPEEYGSRIVWSCQYPAAWGDKHGYDLVVIDTAGAATTVASWSSAGDASGLTATTAIPTGSIRSVEIRVTGKDSALFREDF